MEKSKLKKYFFLLKDSYSEFSGNQGGKLSAALSYYTIFSLPPLLFVIIYILGMVFGKEAVRGEIFSEINSLIGNDAAKQIEEMLASIKFSSGSKIAGIIGVVTLVAGASGVFDEMQDSMNLIWKLKPKPKRGLVKMIWNRF